jgi:enoyl-CoA hydratase/carnithine racemase
VLGVEVPSDLLSVSQEGHVAHVRLKHPPANRFSFAMMHALEDLAHAFAKTPELRAVWLSASGPDFSQGADLKDPMLAAQMAGNADRRGEIARLGGRLVEAWASLPIPTVVSARGRIIGAGACLFTVCDFRYAASDATVAFPEVDRGMHLAWGILPHLAREYGAPVTRRLTLGGRPTSVQQLPVGSVVMESADQVDRSALDWATQMAAKPPLAVHAILSALRAIARGEPHDADLDIEAFAATTGSDDFREALMAWFDRRDGVYKGH